MTDRRTYTGGCQCGNISFTAELALGEVVACNCSRCRRVGHLLAYLPASDLHVRVGAAGLSEYRFNTRTNAHQFCPVCGIQPYALGPAPDGTPSVALNVRCLDGVDVDALPIKRCNGAAY
jgi:hypothetical protein